MTLVWCTTWLTLFNCFACFAFSYKWTPTSCGPTNQITTWGKTIDPYTSEILPFYPRPQMIRGDNSSWINLNGLWDFNGSTHTEINHPLEYSSEQPFEQQILVPFPAESCLSGIGSTFQHLQYKTAFNDFTDRDKSSTRVLIHFGAIDWQSSIYLNGKLLGNHTGGYDSFSFDITDIILSTNNELMVSVYDPSDYGYQPNGKQRISAITNPGGDTYTPSSGIWQTVWLEMIDAPKVYIESYKIYPTLSSIAVNVSINGNAFASITLTVIDPDLNSTIATKKGSGNQLIMINIPQNYIKLWDPLNHSPFLYDLNISINNSNDYVIGYFGLRTITLGQYNDSNTGKMAVRPLLNGNPLFVAGWLDQSFFPDGLYTAPTEDALKFDIQSVLDYGLNGVRLHQKVNPQRWYYWADKLGVIVLQDMIQKYHGANNKTIKPFMSDLSGMIEGKFNHPSIIQWIIFNEHDCWDNMFDDPYISIKNVVQYVKSIDNTRLVDADSGGRANEYHFGDVNDLHIYPYPIVDIKPFDDYQYAMFGEYGGIGDFIRDKEWVKGGCFAYRPVFDSDEFVNVYVNMSKMILDNAGDISVVIYTQLSDVEKECDGYFSYDRTAKFNSTQQKIIYHANQNMIKNMWM